MKLLSVNETNATKKLFEGNDLPNSIPSTENCSLLNWNF